MMSLNDYVKFVTQQIVLKIDEKKEKRKGKRLEKKLERPSFWYRAFGIIPLGISMFLKKRMTRKTE